MHTVSAALKNKVEARIKECIMKAGVQLPPVKVAYDINSAQLGGEAHYSKNLIRVNPVFLNAYTDDYIEQTVGHEAAHLIARAKYGRMIDAHGPEWKRVMVDLGLKPARCHNYSVPAGVVAGKQMTKYECVCSRCSYTTQVGAKVANKLRAGDVATHRGCGGRITLKPDNIVRTGVTPVAKPAAATTARTGTKLDICRSIYLANRLQPRATLIQLFVSQAGCTIAGAATYYSKLKA